MYLLFTLIGKLTDFLVGSGEEINSAVLDMVSLRPLRHVNEDSVEYTSLIFSNKIWSEKIIWDI